ACNLSGMGWNERFVRSQTDEIPQVRPLMQWLVEHTPISPAATLIHNDFKLNNILMHTQDLAQPVAVLDWEMATIGDPLFDLAITLSYWTQADDPEELQCLTACFLKSSSGPRFAMYFTVTPVSERESIAWTYVAMDYGHSPEEEIRRFQ